MKGYIKTDRDIIGKCVILDSDFITCIRMLRKVIIAQVGFIVSHAMNYTLKF